MKEYGLGRRKHAIQFASNKMAIGLGGGGGGE